MIILLASVVLCASLYLFWRHVWFFHNPQRIKEPACSALLRARWSMQAKSLHVTHAPFNAFQLAAAL
jgi:hypothetical protein